MNWHALGTTVSCIMLTLGAFNMGAASEMSGESNQRRLNGVGVVLVLLGIIGVVISCFST